MSVQSRVDVDPDPPARQEREHEHDARGLDGAEPRAADRDPVAGAAVVRIELVDVRGRVLAGRVREGPPELVQRLEHAEHAGPVEQVVERAEVAGVDPVGQPAEPTGPFDRYREVAVDHGHEAGFDGDVREAPAVEQLPAEIGTARVDPEGRREGEPRVVRAPAVAPLRTHRGGDQRRDGVLDEMGRRPGWILVREVEHGGCDDDAAGEPIARQRVDGAVEELPRAEADVERRLPRAGRDPAAGFPHRHLER